MDWLVGLKVLPSCTSSDEAMVTVQLSKHFLIFSVV